MAPLAADDEEARCPECHGYDLVVVSIRDVCQASRKGESPGEVRPVVA
jgi:hypothetical protein